MRVRPQRHLAFIFLCIVVVVLWIEKHHLQVKASELRELQVLKDKQDLQDDIIEQQKLRTNPPTQSPPTLPKTTHIPSPPPLTPSSDDKKTHLLDFSIPAKVKAQCPYPMLHPHKWAERFGWGQRKVFPECPSWHRFSSMEETHSGTMATLTLTCPEDETDPHALLFNELPDSYFHRMTSTADAEMRQNELREEFTLEQLKNRAKNVKLTDGKVTNIVEPYIIAVCGDRFELHVRAPKKPLKGEKKLLGTERPLNVLHFMFDSTSTPALRRSAKQLVSWMENLHNSATSPSYVYTFKHNHAVSCCSPGNQVPMYSGVMNGEGDYFVRSEPHAKSKNWLWNIARELGYTTFWSLDNCPDKSARDYHAFPAVDVRVVAPLCLAGVLLSHKDAACLGGRTVDEHVLHGLKSFWKNYEKNAKFAAIQLITPHEETEKLLIELDYLVSPYFKALEASGDLNNTVVVFWADHGINFGRYASTHDGEVEKMFPFVNIIAPRWVTDGPMHEMLTSNQDMLVTPYDMYQVVRRLLYYPSEVPPYVPDPNNPPLPLPRQSHIVSSLPHLSPFVDISQIALPENRSCTEANIPMEFCTCIPWLPVVKDSPHAQLIDKAVAAHKALLVNHTDVCNDVLYDTIETIDMQTWPTEYRPKDQENAKAIWMKPNRDMVRIRYWTKGVGKGLFEAVLSVGKADPSVFDIAQLTRLDAMTKKCGIVDKVTEILCVCR
jgi:hypothetical protein